MDLSSILVDVSVDLNDHEAGHEYTRWPLEQLRSFAAEALTLIGDSFKDLYMVSEVIPIAPGAGWQRACECSNIMRVIGEADKHGNVISYLTRSADSDFNLWPGPPYSKCHRSVNNYRVSSYSINSADSALFRVDPPMPSGIERFLMAECYKRPAGNLLDSVPDEVVPMVKQWVMYRALSIDSENNPTIVDLAKIHRDTFASLFDAAKARRKEQQDGSNLRAVQKQAAQ